MGKVIDFPEDNTTYSFTPKGWLGAEFGLSMEETDFVWHKLIAFVERTAERDGYLDGLPCLILRGGGECVTICEQEPPK